MKRIVFKDLSSIEILKYFKDEILAIYKSKSQMKNFADCEFEFEIDIKTGKFRWLHIWRGENHKYHEALEIPSTFDLNMDLKYFSNDK